MTAKEFVIGKLPKARCTRIKHAWDDEIEYGIVNGRHIRYIMDWSRGETEIQAWLNVRHQLLAAERKLKLEIRLEKLQEKIDNIKLYR